ncbi:MAG: hypothetical protein K1X74_00675 [Pirellulales bacterium]|nr:hypothetical protein [Pirellulales bacterium]
MQPLEHRQLMAVDVFYHDGYEQGVAYPDREGIYIVGTEEDDHIEVTEKNGIVSIFAARPTGLGFSYIESSKCPNIHFYGNGGNDSFYSTSSATTYLFGGAGNDTLSGGWGHCFVYGEDGEDVLTAGKLAIAEFYGGAGRDTINGTALGDKIWGGAGLDMIYGNAGDDTIECDEDGAIAFGGAGDDRFYGGSGSDLIYGEDGEDYAEGRGGMDDLFGGQGNDTLFGGSGSDHLEGGAGSDQLNGEGGEDYLYGFEYFLHFGGNSDGDFDKLIGGRGRDYFFERYRSLNGQIDTGSQGIYDYNPAEGDIILTLGLDRFIAQRYSASWIEMYENDAQGAGLAATAAQDWEPAIEAYEDAALWSDLYLGEPLDADSSNELWDDPESLLTGDEELVEGGEDVLALDGFFEALAEDPAILDPAPELYEQPTTNLIISPLTLTSVQRGIRWGAF